MSPLQRLRRLGSIAKVAADFMYDFGRYMHWSASGAKPLTDDQLVARLFKNAHSIEKALALPSIRPGFGEKALTELLSNMREFEVRFSGRSNAAYVKAQSAISSYLAHHQNVGHRLPEGLAHSLEARLPKTIGGSTVRLLRDDVTKRAQGDFASLVGSRHSTRMFAAEPAPTDSIEKAVGLALRTPSVCNRQGSRVHVLRDPDLLRRVLELQGGARGFKDEVTTVLVVTCALSIFKGGRERNQVWIDGGLFAMTLIYSLHYLGLGTCPLNWSADRSQDKRLREIINLPSSENVVLMLAVGTLRDEYSVAQSPRRPLTAVMSNLDSVKCR